jgi:hypothetical protein
LTREGYEDEVKRRLESREKGELEWGVEVGPDVTAYSTCGVEEDVRRNEVGSSPGLEAKERQDDRSLEQTAFAGPGRGKEKTRWKHAGLELK